MDIARIEQKLLIQKINVQEDKRYLKNFIETHKIFMGIALASMVYLLWKMNPGSWITRFLGTPLNFIMLLKKFSLI